ncbi:probable sugar phosphate/phosphate translocator At1g12500 [Chenopodium quinoa]|uniref:probable sugar phosphate/phosphate translocator At1g12500 n=1 Tax=Chenopodium quinoa TaxID=63459 RepID=UPI000B7814ED|nr:probable sugar phosphate/phosphate translocator At1g12500 [Chenopodium quinoa]
MVVEPPTKWTPRRNSNPKLDTSPDQILLEMPQTPPSDARNNIHHIAAVSATTSITTLTIVLAWYSSNIGVLLLNKYLLTIYGYRYPIFLTTIHMIACTFYSSFAIHSLRLVPAQYIQSRKQLLKIFSLSVIFCFSVVCGNASLKYIPVSFNQAIGATTPFFTAIFAFVITCKKEAPIVYFSLLPVVLGIVVASNSEPLFHLFGFFLCVGSTSGRALKSVVQGLLLTSDSEKLNSMNLLMYMAPMAAAVLLPFSLYIEGNVAGITIQKAKQDWFIVFLLVGNATVAYLVNLTNFLVTKHTSALTLQVLGNAKAAVAAVVSVFIFRNPVTAMGMVGFGVTVMGVVLYTQVKRRSKLTAH